MMRVIADISITPIGTEKVSISDFIAASEKALQNYSDLSVQLNPMSTTIEGELERVLQAVRDMHEAPFKVGAKRLSTTIRIDDRRDGSFESIQNRVKVVQQKVGATI